MDTIAWFLNKNDYSTILFFNLLRSQNFYFIKSLLFYNSKCKEE